MWPAKRMYTFISKELMFSLWGLRFLLELENPKWRSEKITPHISLFIKKIGIVLFSVQMYFFFKFRSKQTAAKSRNSVYGMCRCKQCGTDRKHWVASSVSDLDWIRIQSGQWIPIRMVFGIRIRICIQECKNYPQK